MRMTQMTQGYGNGNDTVQSSAMKGELIKALTLITLIDGTHPALI
jgi:hypothetical protein